MLCELMNNVKLHPYSILTVEAITPPRQLACGAPEMTMSAAHLRCGRGARRPARRSRPRGGHESRMTH